MVQRENILPDLCDHVVSLDLPAVTNRSIIEFGMEIFITHQHVQFVTVTLIAIMGWHF